MRAKIKKTGFSKQIVYAEVYAPFSIDTDMEAATQEEVEKMAHDFLMSGKIDQIDLVHNEKPTGSKVVESYIAKANDPDGFTENSWVVGVKIFDNKLWKDVLDGEINGFSFGGSSFKIPADVKVIEVKKVAGVTEENNCDIIPTHSHEVSIEFSPDGEVIKTRTHKNLDHSHEVIALTATEMEVGHAHILKVNANA